MTPLRATDLQLFLILAEAAIRHQSGVDGRVRLAAKRMFTALQAPSTQAVPQASRLPVCRHLDRALENARHRPGSVAAWPMPLPSSSRGSPGRSEMALKARNSWTAT